MKHWTFLFLAMNCCFLSYSQAEKLEVDGAIRISNSDNLTPEAGIIRFNPNTNDFEGFDGNRWLSLTNPNLNTGDTNLVEDIDGNVYLTVKIDTNIWMKENLRTSRYADGTPIAHVVDSSLWFANDSTGKFCWYNNDGAQYDKYYGKLYNWYAVNDERGLCPTGWHVPSEAEYNALKTFLGASQSGSKMKVYNSVLWTAANDGATNESGFTGIPGGRRGFSGSDALGTSGQFWTKSETNDFQANMGILHVGLQDLLITTANKSFGLSVRCVRKE